MHKVSYVEASPWPQALGAYLLVLIAMGPATPADNVAVSLSIVQASRIH